MTWKVRVEVGKGKDKSIAESIPLPSKKRVCRYLKRSPFVRSNTQVKVTDLKTKEVTIGTQSKFCRGDF